MLSFCWSMLVRSWQETVSAMGTTTLAIAVAFLVIPILLLGITWMNKGWDMVKKTWQGNAVVVAVTVAIWLIIFTYHLLYSVPLKIRQEANGTAFPPMPEKITRISRPSPEIAYEKTVSRAVTGIREAKIEVADIKGVDAINDQDKRRGFYFNIFYIKQGYDSSITHGTPLTGRLYDGRDET